MACCFYMQASMLLLQCYKTVTHRAHVPRKPCKSQGVTSGYLRVVLLIDTIDFCALRDKRATKLQKQRQWQLQTLLLTYARSDQKQCEQQVDELYELYEH